MPVPPEVQFAHKLAGNEKTERDQGVRKLKKWFYVRSSGENPFTENELLRIWKGLFYCFWMSDKPLIQEELAESISAMIDNFASEEASLLFVKTFLTTMGREWFSIDMWRKPKFMLLVRRFIRRVFKLNRKNEWTLELAQKISSIFGEDLFLCKMTNALGFKMHVIDVFMEELAKVGGEELPNSIIDIYMQPFYKVLMDEKDFRYVKCVSVGVFEHLMRQSDCGIQWEVEKDVEELKHVELVDDENMNEDEGVVLDPAEEMELQVGSAEDPRAGNVSTEIPQLNVDYGKISEKLFELGSADTTRGHVRNNLYTLSKQFKDVSQAIFPLNDEVPASELHVEHIHVHNSVNKWINQEKNVKERNVKEKEELKRAVQKRKKAERKMAREAVTETEEEEEMEEDRDSDDEYEVDEHGVKRKCEETAESPETKKARLEENKEKRKAAERKRKGELRRRKRERLLEEKMKQHEEEKKAQALLDKDLEIQAAISQESKKKTATVDNSANNEKNTGDKVEKKKKENKASQSILGVSTSAEEDKAEKKKKKKKEKKASQSILDVSAIVDVENKGEKKKKEKKDKSFTEVAATFVLEEKSNDQVVEKKKKKKDKKATETVEKESDKAIPKINEDNTPVKNKKKKHEKEVKKVLHELVKPTMILDQSIGEEKKKSKKKDKKKLNKSDGKLFDESQDWDSPLQPGEQEIVVPSKKYKGDVKLAPAAEGDTDQQQGFEDFSAPTVTTPKMSHTSKFLAKAMSKSNTPKKKLSQVEKLKTKLSSSESKVKRVNWALARNTSQTDAMLFASIKSSPGIPHDPRRQPEKGLLKRKSLSGTSSPSLNPVSLNTQINSISKKGVKMQMKLGRMSASQFFQ